MTDPVRSRGQATAMTTVCQARPGSWAAEGGQRWRAVGTYGRARRGAATASAGWRSGRPRAGQGFRQESDADRHGAATEADKLRGVYVDPRRGVMLARDYGELKFLPSLVHLRPNSASTYTSHLRTHWWPLLGDRQIRSLSRSDMKAAVAALAGSLAPSTVE